MNIIESKVICWRPGQMYGWPGIVKAANGDILVAASERKFHCCPFGREVMIRSKDNGYTWSLPEEIYNSPLDDRDANLVKLNDDSIILSWFSSTSFEEIWPDRLKSLTPEAVTNFTGTWFLRSFNHGKTWSKSPNRIPAGVHISPAVLSDDTLISIGPKYNKEKTIARLFCYKSNDVGLNWHETAEIKSPLRKNGNIMLDENHIIETSPGQLLALFRSGENLHTANSEDYGMSWSTPIPIPVWGFPAQMLKLSDGRILCSYSKRKKPYSIEAVISNDSGKTWDIKNTMRLYIFEDECDMGYPSSIELDNKDILTVFYVSRCDVNLHNSHLKNYFQKVGSSPEGLLSVRFRL